MIKKRKVKSQNKNPISDKKFHLTKGYISKYNKYEVDIGAEAEPTVRA